MTNPYKAKPTPLSHGQQALWLIHQIAPKSAAYNVAFTIRVRSAVDVRAMRAAFQCLTDRHAALRTVFSTQDQGPAQFVQEERTAFFEHVNLPAPDEMELKRQVIAAQLRPFDLERGPLTRTHLLTRSATDHVLMMVTHHIALDGSSIGLLLDDFLAGYDAERNGRAVQLPAIKRQHTDYVAWEQEMLAGPEGARGREFWHRRLAGELPPLNLPVDRPYRASQIGKGATYEFVLDADVLAQVQGLARWERMTLFTVLLSAFDVLLGRYTGQDDIIVGTPIGNRSQEEFHKTVGYIANLVALRIDLSGNPTVRELFTRVRETVLGALEHQSYPFSLLVQELKPERDPHRTPIVEVMFNLRRSEDFGTLGSRWERGPDGILRANVSGLLLEPFNIPQEEGRFDITLDFIESDDRVEGYLRYNDDLFDESTIVRLVESYRLLLKAMAERPELAIRELPVLPAAVEKQVLVDWNASGATYPDARLHELIAARAAGKQGAVAAVFEGEMLTYAELDRRANQLGHHLQTLGVGPEVLVGLCVERSLDMLIGLLGILKAGGAYVPLDPTYPRDRIAFMLADSKVPVLVSQQRILADLPKGTARTVCLDSDRQAVERHPATAPASTGGAQSLAYVIYTSGSTGQPKGVQITHRGLVNLLTSMQREPGFSEQDVLLAVTTLSFDIAGLELYLPLLTGGRLVVASREVASDGAALRRLLIEHGVTVMQATPVTWRLLLEAGGPPSHLKVLCGGEPLPPDLAAALLSHPVELWNMYGPTETTIWSTVVRVTSSESITVGRPIANTECYVLDPYGKPVPVGVVGELFIGGDCVARGYLDRPELTAERFVRHPFRDIAGARLYKTGDHARYRADGRLEILGRADNQVKLRGYRIELGEIEAIVARQPTVHEVTVIAREDVAGDKRLVGYVTAAGGQAPTAADLRAAVREQLPDYMVPSTFVILDAMPRTLNGKVSPKALPPPDIDQARVVDAAYVAPETELQRTIAQVWSEVLRVERVGLHDNFFDLGGHSLLLLEVHQRLSGMVEKPITVADLFRFPNVHSLARHLAEQSETTERPSVPGRLAHRRANTGHSLGRDIAIVGLSGRFPGARNVQEFWRNICEGRESVSFFSSEELQSAGIDPYVLADPNYIRAKGVIDDADMFDAGFFGINPPEAEVMDPQHRIFLECAWEALEDANCDPATYEGAIGVFAGASMNTYLLTNLRENPAGMYALGAYHAMIGNDKDFLATRASYKLNLRGPSMTVQTACSTSLVAVHLACQSLMSGDSDMVLAGAVSVSVPHRAGYFYEEGMILSPDGHCRPFDAAAAGTVSGEGCGIVVLKRLADARADGDYIYAVLKGISVNNDGSTKLGYTAPSVDGQASVIATAQMLADASPETIGYVEAHGTGTPLGDPVEIAALTRAFQEGTSRHGYCAIGSVKANIGHLDVAAGMAGLIKATLAVKHGLIPPSVNFSRPNPKIDFLASPFYVPTRLAEWPAADTPRRAGVSSFGIGGTNAHAVLEQAPRTKVATPGRGWEVMPLSARTLGALDAANARLADHLEQNPELQARDVAFTLQTGRRSFSKRRVVICAEDEVASQILRSGATRRVLTGSVRDEPGVVFMFSGQGAQYANMARGLYEAEAAFRSTVDACAISLHPHLGLDLRTLIFPDEEATEDATSRLQQTALAQPALFVIEYALARLYMSWGVRPRALIGHSIGEYVAACLAGVLSQRDALALVAARGKLMQHLPCGAMLSVPLPEAEVAPLLGPELSLAVINAPGLCVVAGPSDAIDGLQRALTGREVETRRLFTSHAFHSAMMEPAVEPFTERVRQVALQPPSIPFISNVSGTWITPAQATDPAYWAQHMRRTVRFGDGIALLLKSEDSVLLEVGPGQTLATLVRQHPARDSARAILNSVRHPNQTAPDVAVLLTALAQLWLAGVPINWRALHGEPRPRRVSLPTYPFERQRYWLDATAAPPSAGSVTSGISGASRYPATSVQYSVPVWQQRPLAATTVTVRPVAESWLVFLDEQGLAERVAVRLRVAGKRVVSVLPGAAFGQLDVDRYTVAPTKRADYEALLDDLRSKGQVPQGVLHCWSVTENDQVPPLESLAGYEERGFYSLLALVQAADGRLTSQPLKVVVISNDMQDVIGDEPICAAKATLLGVTKVVPLELPSITCQSVDVRLPPPGSSAEEQLATQLAEEALSGAADGLVAYRGRYRWSQILTPIELAGPIGERIVRPGGTYLITGGLGGIALVLADYLAQQAPINLVLLGRSPLPPPTGWERWLVEHNATDPVSERIRAVRALENRGAQVLVASADVSRLDDMEAVLKQVRDRFGAVHGVIHSAGIGDYGMLVLREPEQAAGILAPKVRGTLVLDHLLSSDPLDFFVSCSSIAALLPAAGQIDYSGANAFLDAFAHAAATRSQCRHVAINWDNWREVGMAVSTEVRPALKSARDEAVASGLLSSQGQAAFDALVHRRLPQALVTTKVAADLVRQPSPEPGGERAAAPETTATRRSRRERPEMGNSYAPPRTETEGRIIDIWQDLLGIEPVGIHDDFFELGGHSLLATQLISRVSKTFGVGVSLRSLFDAATIADFAAQVDAIRPSFAAEEREELVL